MTEFENIYKQYFKDVFLYLKGLSGNESVAEELTQETFFKAMRSIDKFKGDCSIRVWLCQIAKNSLYTYQKKQCKITDDSILESEPDKFNIEIEYADHEASLLIHTLLHQMEEPYKEVFNLRVFGELSFTQIGAIFGKTENWACVTYHRAKQKIYRQMEGI
ncbi:MAG: RNA polymerase sigma factor [Eubacteriales bacterium]